MLHPNKAIQTILDHTPTLPSETAALGETIDRVLAEKLKARDDLPPFDNSAMDGYAVKAADLQGADQKNPVRLLVRETVRAGRLSCQEVQAGEAVKIMTGAPLPKGADAVVMKERTISDGDGMVDVLHCPEPGDHIRPKGEDMRAGDPLLSPGTLLRHYEVALLAAQGVTKVKVIRKAQVAILATGDELVPTAGALSPGKIRNSNGPAILAALSKWRISAKDLGIVPDDEKEMEKRLRGALSQADVVLVSGGVSVGDFDYTRALFAKLGVQEVFWKVAIKPGKPLLFGIHSGGSGPGKLVFGLPGNPVSALVCLEEFVRPALEKLCGHVPTRPSYHLQGRALNDYPKPKDRQQYLFCRVSSDRKGFALHILRPQGSARLCMTTQANALAIGPIGVRRIRKGDALAFRWLK
ncbi:MAG: molybdopterin molybdotransferase MoeA [Elusimicrobia bacterium]|nr:molybdopterin molybdotransferase MoeA [Elusimicrobiota bacterium]